MVSNNDSNHNLVLEDAENKDFFMSHANEASASDIGIWKQETSAVLKLKGLPYSTTKENILEFFAGYDIKRVSFVYEADGRASGLGFAEFETVEGAMKARNAKNNKYLGERYVRLLHVSRIEMEEQTRLGTQAIPGAASKNQAKLQAKTGAVSAAAATVSNNNVSSGSMTGSPLPVSWRLSSASTNIQELNLGNTSFAISGGSGGGGGGCSNGGNGNGVSIATPIQNIVPNAALGSKFGAPAIMSNSTIHHQQQPHNLQLNLVQPQIQPQQPLQNNFQSTSSSQGLATTWTPMSYNSLSGGGTNHVPVSSHVFASGTSLGGFSAASCLSTLSSANSSSSSNIAAVCPTMPSSSSLNPSVLTERLSSAPTATLSLNKTISPFSNGSNGNSGGNGGNGNFIGSAGIGMGALMNYNNSNSMSNNNLNSNNNNNSSNIANNSIIYNNAANLINGAINASNNNNNNNNVNNVNNPILNSLNPSSLLLMPYSSIPLSSLLQSLRSEDQFTESGTISSSAMAAAAATAAAATSGISALSPSPNNFSSRPSTANSVISTSANASRNSIYPINSNPNSNNSSSQLTSISPGITFHLSPSPSSELGDITTLSIRDIVNGGRSGSCGIVNSNINSNMNMNMNNNSAVSMSNNCSDNNNKSSSVSLPGITSSIPTLASMVANAHNNDLSNGNAIHENLNMNSYTHPNPFSNNNNGKSFNESSNLIINTGSNAQNPNNSHSNTASHNNNYYPNHLSNPSSLLPPSSISSPLFARSSSASSCNFSASSVSSHPPDCRTNSVFPLHVPPSLFSYSGGGNGGGGNGGFGGGLYGGCTAVDEGLVQDLSTIPIRRHDSCSSSSSSHRARHSNGQYIHSATGYSNGNIGLDNININCSVSNVGNVNGATNIPYSGTNIHYHQNVIINNASGSSMISNGVSTMATNNNSNYNNNSNSNFNNNNNNNNNNSAGSFQLPIGGYVKGPTTNGTYGTFPYGSGSQHGSRVGSCSSNGMTNSTFSLSNSTALASNENFNSNSNGCYNLNNHYINSNRNFFGALNLNDIAAADLKAQHALMTPIVSIPMHLPSSRGGPDDCEGERQRSEGRMDGGVDSTANHLANSHVSPSVMPSFPLPSSALAAALVNLSSFAPSAAASTLHSWSQPHHPPPPQASKQANKQTNPPSHISPPPPQRCLLRIASTTPTIKIRGLPFKSTPNEILDFFAGYNYIPDSLQIGLDSLGRPSGEAWITFSDSQEATRVVANLNKQFLKNRYLELSMC